MISHLKGHIVHTSPTEIVIDVNGVGYAVTIPLSTFEKIEHTTGQATILTYLHVREDAMLLYGFATETEREIFKALITVSGIGPKMALGVLSGMSTGEIRNAIVQGNLAALTSISGIGRKTAERIVIELRDKLGKAEMTETSVIPSSKQMKARSEAIIALMSLGHSRQTAEQALLKVVSESVNKDISVEEMIKRALQYTSK